MLSKTFRLNKIKSIDLGKVSAIDSAGVAFLDELSQKFSPKMVNASKEVEAAIKTFSSLRISSLRPEKPPSFLENLGGSFYNGKDSFINGLFLAADIAYWSFIGIFNKKGQRKGSTIAQSPLIGVDALGIIGLLSLIIGLILALQSAAQLRQFGASIFVADLIAISMVREMGPMMTAIIVAGRSGSSIAAEIATMKVTEEIDALKMALWYFL